MFIDKIGNIYSDTEKLYHFDQRTGCKLQFFEIHSLLGKIYVSWGIKMPDTLWTLRPL